MLGLLRLLTRQIYCSADVLSIAASHLLATRNRHCRGLGANFTSNEDTYGPPFDRSGGGVGTKGAAQTWQCSTSH